LGALKDPSAIDVLATLSADQDENVAVNAIRALVTIGDARGVPPAAAALASSSPVVRWEALLALAALPPDAALRGKAIAHIGDPEPWMRAAALRALAHVDRENLALVLSG